MMKRRLFISLGLAACLAGAPAMASSVQDEVVEQLSDQGFSHIRVSRTLLGRVRIIATSPTHEREIILNGRTGEILRDYWTAVGATSGAAAQIPDPSGSARSSGSGGADDDGGDDDDDDDSGDGGNDDDRSDDDSNDDDDDHDHDDDNDDDDSEGGDSEDSDDGGESDESDESDDDDDGF